MDEEERALRIALWMVPGITSVHLLAMVSRFGSLRGALLQPREALAARLGLAPATARALVEAPANLATWARGLEKDLALRGGRFLLRGEHGSPHLSTLDVRPEVLSLRGTLGWAGEGREPRAVAVIGARKADIVALRLARQMGRALAQAGFTVVSGGALGVDAAAHLGALEGGGATVAVLGSGVLRPEPAGNRKLFATMLEAGGGLLSELPPRMRPSSWHFPRRNRLIAALSHGVVVIRAAERSGCTHTVEAARRLGRRVFAVPAPELGERAAGSEAYLATGATAVRDADELLGFLGVASAAPPPEARLLAPDEQLVLDVLAAAPAPLLLLAETAGLAPGNVARIIASLCARGLVRPQGPGCFARS